MEGNAKEQIAKYYQWLAKQLGANGLTMPIVAFGMAPEADSWLYGESATPLCKDS
ncbi:hypothetical protein [Microcoleus sp. D2_18a_B4]|uniref:hypothetical protein n=1 Tax=Microcoleus sp. D2_18a_B4 TaxID=3055329 RepID=UPI002FD11C51